MSNENQPKAQHRADTKREEILQTACRLFLKNGYNATGMRAIAEGAGVSLGLISYYFTSKRDMAMALVQQKLEQIKRTARLYIDEDDCPLVYSSVLLRLRNIIFSTERYFLFYHDALKEDIFFDVVAGSGIETFLKIQTKYRPDMTHAEALQMGVYGNYILISLERTLVLFGERESMNTIPIPDRIFHAYMALWNLDNFDELMRIAIERSQNTAELILREHSKLYL